MDVLILVVWLLMTLAWINPNIHASAKWVKSSIIGMVCGGILSFLVLYFAMPPLIPIAIVAMVFIMLLFNAVIRIWIESEVVQDSIGKGVVRSAVISIAVIILLVLGALCTPAFYAKELHRIPGVITEQGVVDMISIDHIRVVPYDTALWKADKKVGELGYKLEVQEPHIQYREEELKWLVPLEYNGLYKSWKYGSDGVEGYITVSAEDSTKEPERILGLQMRCIPSGVFGNYLYRHIYAEYPSYFQKESVFQLGDNGEPIYVTMLSRPSILGITGEKPAGVVITNPQTREQNFYNMNNIPDHIQRVMDESLTEKYLGWWGSYVGGWWNSWWSQRNVKTPTGGIDYERLSSGETAIIQGEPDVYLVYGKDGKLYWFSAITTPGEDTSMVGYMLIDVKKWPLDIKFYPCEGVFNDIGAAQNIQQDADVSKVMGFKVSQPIMYVVEGNEVWIGPVLSSRNEVKAVGLVQARGGVTFVADELDQARAEYDLWRGAVRPVIPGAETTSEQLIQEIRELIAQVNSRLDQLVAA